MSDTPRLAPAADADLDLETAELVGRLGGLTFFRTLAHHPALRALDQHPISDQTWQRLTGFLGTQQVMDLVFTVGQYALVSMALNSFGVPLDAGVPGFPT